MADGTFTKPLVVQPAASGGGPFAEPVRLVNPDGSPYDPSTGATPAAGSVTTEALADKAVTKAKIADGVIPATPTADTLSGATTVCRSVLKATDAASARTAIGAGTPYTLPAASTTALGGVKQAAAIPDLATDADLTTTAAKVNAIIAAARTAGLIAS